MGATADRMLAWHLCRCLAAEGVDWASALAPGTVPPTAGGRMPFDALVRLWGRGLDAVSEPQTLPLRVLAGIAADAHVSPLHLYTQTAPTLGDAVEAMASHWSSVTDAFGWRRHSRPRGPELVGVFEGSLEDPGLRGLVAFLTVEAVWAGRVALGQGFRPRAVRFPFRVGPEADWRDLLGIPPDLEATHLAIAFHGPDLHRRPQRSDPALSRVLVDLAARLAHAAPPDDITVLVRNEIRLQLQQGPPSLEAAARALGRSGRSLHRDLAAADTGFRALCDEVRFSLAQQLLPRHPPAEVAQRLGYAETRPFQRAFQRWAGCSPGAWAAGERSG